MDVNVTATAPEPSETAATESALKCDCAATMGPILGEIKAQQSEILHQLQSVEEEIEETAEAVDEVNEAVEAVAETPPVVIEAPPPEPTIEEVPAVEPEPKSKEEEAEASAPPIARKHRFM